MRRQKRRRQSFLLRNWKKVTFLLIVLVVLLMAVKLAGCVRGRFTSASREITLSEEEISALQPELDVELLTVNEFSRPGTPLSQVNGIVIHYTANPGATARQNRDYFEGLKDSQITKASSHFIVGLDGEIVQCIPSWEVAYASNKRNGDTIAIECCHPDETGRFNKETYQSMVNLTAWLCVKFGLDSEDVIRHYDVTGKICPKYFVEDEEAWGEFKEYVQDAIDKAQ